MHAAASDRAALSSLAARAAVVRASITSSRNFSPVLSSAPATAEPSQRLEPGVCPEEELGRSQLFKARIGAR
jgi:hypothetical protein